MQDALEVKSIGEKVSCYNRSMKIVMILIFINLYVGASEWHLVKEKNSVKVYTREVEGSDFLEFRGETVVQGTVAALVAVLYDTANCPAWLHECSYAMTLEEVSFEENYIFEIYDLSFPVSDRGVILHSKLSWRANIARLETQEVQTFCDERTTTRCQKVNDLDVTPIKRSRGVYTFKTLGKNRTEVVWQQHVEPGGSIPTWLVNAMVVDLPYETLLKLQTLVLDIKYAEMTEKTLRAMWSHQYEAHH